MARASVRIALRPMLPQDGEALVALFRASIEELTADDYTEDQQSGWMSAADDEESFLERLAGWLTLVATIDGEIAGFASLEMPSVIQMLYVEPQSAGQGVATTLLDAIEKLAVARGAKSLTVEASDTAEPLFRKRGFKPKHRATVLAGGEWLGRTAMEKSFGNEAAKP